MGITYSTSSIARDRDGLVLHLDAANVKSYPGSGTVWKDLSVNANNGNLLDGASIANGVINLDGSSDGVNISNFPGIWNNSVTMESWCYFTTANTRDLICGTYDSVLDINFERHTSDRLRIYWNADDNYSANGAVPANQWLHIVMIRDKENSKLKFYVNGLLNTEISKSVTDYTTIEDMKIGRDSRTDSTNMAGSIGVIKFYALALTDAEVKQNFEALRGRYGI